MAEKPLLVALWAVPRSRSTAFFRMMLNRGDFLCLHEPINDIADLGRVVLPDSSSATAVLETEKAAIFHIRKLAATRSVFLKETMEFDYHFRYDVDFLRHARHCMIIREPRATVLSHLRMRPHLSCIQVGFENLYRLFQAVSEASGEAPVIVDSDVLVRDPEDVVEQFCERVGIPFIRDALTWQPGHQQAWKRSALWHEKVSGTTGFEQPLAREADDPLTEDPRLERFVDHHRPFYEELLRHAIVPRSKAGGRAA